MLLNAGFYDEIPVEKVQAYEQSLLTYLEDQDKKILSLLATEKNLTEEIEKLLKKALTEHQQMFIKELENQG